MIDLKKKVMILSLSGLMSCQDAASSLDSAASLGITAPTFQNIVLEQIVDKNGFLYYNINVDVSANAEVKEIWYEADFISGGGSIPIQFRDNIRIDAEPIVKKDGEQITGGYIVSHLIKQGTDAHLYALDYKGNKAEAKVDWDSLHR